MIRTQITELDELAGAIIESARRVDARYTRGDIVLLLNGERYVIIHGSAGNFPGDEPYPYLGTDGLSSYHFGLIELGLVDEDGLREIERLAKIEVKRRAQYIRMEELEQLARLKERYER